MPLRFEPQHAAISLSAYGRAWAEQGERSAPELLPAHHRPPPQPDLRAVLPAGFRDHAGGRGSIFVLDHDDLLKCEHGLNYQLMHNAIAQVAAQYGEQYPIIPQIARALASARTKPYEPALPRICMSQAGFREFSMHSVEIKTPFYFRTPANGDPHMIADLLSRVDALVPGASAALTQYDRIPEPHASGTTFKSFRDRLETMLFVEFQRQYQRLIAPPLIAAPTARRPAVGRLRDSASTAEFMDELDAALGKIQAERHILAPSKQHAPSGGALTSAKLPFEQPKLELLPGAARLLRFAAQSKALIIVLTNRSHSMAAKEFALLQREGALPTSGNRNTLEFALSGRPTLTHVGDVIDGGINESRWVKPNNTRLEAILDSLPKHSGVHDADLYLFGDSLSDVAQANDLKHHTGYRAGFVINPRFAQRRPTHETSTIGAHIPTTYLATLTDFPFDRINSNLERTPQSTMQA